MADLISRIREKLDQENQYRQERAENKRKDLERAEELANRYHDQLLERIRNEMTPEIFELAVKKAIQNCNGDRTLCARHIRITGEVLDQALNRRRKTKIPYEYRKIMDRYKLTGAEILEALKGLGVPLVAMKYHVYPVM